MAVDGKDSVRYNVRQRDIAAGDSREVHVVVDHTPVHLYERLPYRERRRNDHAVAPAAHQRLGLLPLSPFARSPR